MAFRTDISIDWTTSPRIITLAAPSTEITIQELYDTLRDLEGRIYDSVIQGLSITGGFALRSGWGRDRSFAFSIGGVHPGFTPPANFPTLDRMGVDLSRGSSFQFRLGGYFAITSNSLQLGARADLKVQQAGFTVLADVGFDALFIFGPERRCLHDQIASTKVVVAD